MFRAARYFAASLLTDVTAHVRGSGEPLLLPFSRCGSSSMQWCFLFRRQAVLFLSLDQFGDSPLRFRRGLEMSNPSGVLPAAMKSMISK
jgi:hypothetical protein